MVKRTTEWKGPYQRFFSLGTWLYSSVIGNLKPWKLLRRPDNSFWADPHIIKGRPFPDQRLVGTKDARAVVARVQITSSIRISASFGLSTARVNNDQSTPGRRGADGRYGIDCSSCLALMAVCGRSKSHTLLFMKMCPWK